MSSSLALPSYSLSRTFSLHMRYGSGLSPFLNDFQQPIAVELTFLCSDWMLAVCFGPADQYGVIFVPHSWASNGRYPVCGWKSKIPLFRLLTEESQSNVVIGDEAANQNVPSFLLERIKQTGWRVTATKWWEAALQSRGPRGPQVQNWKFFGGLLDGPMVKKGWFRAQPNKECFLMLWYSVPRRKHLHILEYVGSSSMTTPMLYFEKVEFTPEDAVPQHQKTFLMFVCFIPTNKHCQPTHNYM